MASWIIMGLPAGALVDRWDRQRVMILADLGRVLVLTVFGLLVAAGQASITALTGTVFLIGVGTCFFAPASQAILPELVGRERTQLTAANGKFWGFDTFGRALAGPPLGALTFTAARAIPFLADAASFVISAFLITRLPRHSYRSGGQTSETVRALIAGGARYMLQDRQLRSLALAAGAYNLAYNIVFSTLVLFALSRLGLGTLGFGLLISIAAFGGVIAGWVTPRYLARMRPISVYAAAYLVQTAAWLAIVTNPNVAVACISLAFVGLASTAVTVSGGSARQMLAPAGHIGRVAATTRLVSSGSAAIGAFAGGVLAKYGGQNATFFVAAALLITFALVAFWHLSQVPQTAVTPD
jgi:MFS family permease